MRTVVFIVITLLSATARAQAPKPRIVIAPIAAPHTLEGARDAVVSEVRSSVEQANAFRIVKADAVRTMIAVSPSAACPQTRCAMRLARLVEADMVLTGEITEHDGAVNVALRIYDVRDGEITHRLAFDVSTKRDALARDVDNNVRSMLGLSVRSKPQATSHRIELAAN